MDTQTTTLCNVSYILGCVGLNLEHSDKCNQFCSGTDYTQKNNRVKWKKEIYNFTT